MVRARPMLLLLAGVFGGCLFALGHRAAVIIPLGLAYLFWILQGRRRERNGIESYGRWTAQTAGIFLCFLLGALRMSGSQQFFSSVAEDFPAGDTHTFTGKIADREETEDSHIYLIRVSLPRGRCLIRVDASDADISGAGMDGAADVEMSGTGVAGSADMGKTREGKSASIGQSISVSGTVQQTRVARNEGAFDFLRYDQSRGIALRMKAAEIRLGERPVPGFREALRRLRDAVCQVYESMLPGEEGGLLAGLVLGDRSAMDPEARQLLSNAGLAHVLAVSGTHVGILGRRTYRRLRKWSLPFATAGLLSGSLLVCYCLLCGGSVSAVRATGMFLCFLLGEVLGESYDAVSAASAVASAMLLFRPSILFGTGFQLSFGAAFVICFVCEPLQRRMRESFPEQGPKPALVGRILPAIRSSRILPAIRNGCILPAFRRGRIPSAFQSGRAVPMSCARHIASALLYAVAVQLGMLPLTLQLFCELPVYSVLLNLFLLPLLSPLLMLGLAGGLLGVIGAALPAAASEMLFLLLRPVFGICHAILYLMEASAGAALSLPGARLCTGAPGWTAAMLYWGILLWIIYGRRLKRNDGPAHGKIFQLLRGTCFCVLMLYLLFGRRFSGPDFVMLDMGQGTGIYVSGGPGMRCMIDGGSTTETRAGTYEILPFLKYHGVTRIDWWFVSHTDRDHVSGLLELLEQGYPVGTILLPAAEDQMSRQMLQRIRGLAEENGTEVAVLYPSDRVETGGGALSVLCLSPTAESIFTGANDNSLVLWITWQGTEIFFGGDISETVENALAPQLREADIYIVNHHGSGTASGTKLLEAIRPACALISCAERNVYGHPDPDVLARLHAVEAEIRCTKDEGQLRVRMRKGTVSVEGYLRP